MKSTQTAFQAPKMSSQGLQGVILVPTWQPPTPQTLQNPPVFIGFYRVSQMPSGTTLGEFGMPKAPQNRPKELQDEPKELPRTPKAIPSGAQKHQSGPQGPPRTPKVTHKASIVCKKHAKVTQKASKVRSNTPQGRKTTLNNANITCCQSAANQYIKYINQMNQSVSQPASQSVNISNRQ